MLVIVFDLTMKIWHMYIVLQVHKCVLYIIIELNVLKIFISPTNIAHRKCYSTIGTCFEVVAIVTAVHKCVI